MKVAVLGVCVVCLFCGALFASEEEILRPRTVALTADGGKTFGKVGAAIETSGTGERYRIKALTLSVGGNKIEVPEGQFRDLRDPLIGTSEFRWEAGRNGGSALLYLTFRLAKQGATTAADYPRAYIRVRDGKLLDRSIHDPLGQKAD